MAAIPSVVQICQQLRIDLHTYLLDILPHLADTSIKQPAEPTPTAWPAQRR